MGKKTEFFKDGNKYVATTGESPTGFKGTLFVCFTGPNSKDVKECLIERKQLTAMDQVAEVPDDWTNAFRLCGLTIKEPVVEKPKTAPRQPSPRRLAPRQPAPRRLASRRQTELTVNLHPDRNGQVMIGAWLILSAGFYIFSQICRVITWLMK